MSNAPSIPAAPVNERGYSLVEALVALSLLAAALIFILGAFSSFTVITSHSQSRTNAAAAARTRMEQVRVADPATLPTTGSDSMLSTVGQHVFTVVTEYCQNSSYCDDITRHVVITVQEDGQDVFQTETVVTQLR